MADFAAVRNQRACEALVGKMDNFRLDDKFGRSNSDRRLILVDFPPRQQGIAAALRRAFGAVHGDPDECEFDLLLAKLH